MSEHTIATTDEIPEGTSKIVTIQGKDIAVFNTDGEFYAISNTCPHRGGSLGEGFVADNVVTCPMHGWQFDVTTGKSPTMSNVCIQTYDVETRGDDIIVII